MYARAEVMIANPFRESGSDLLKATLSLVVSPMVFVHRVEMLGRYRTIVDLIDWINVPFRDFTFVPSLGLGSLCID